VSAAAARAARTDRFRRWGRRLGVAPVALIVGALVPLPSAGGSSLLGLPNLCGFRALTGIPCPGCGLTRAVVCCCHLRFSDALHFHPLGLLLFGGLVAISVLRLTGAEKRLRPNAYEWAAAGFVSLLLLWWVLRLLHVLPWPP